MSGGRNITQRDVAEAEEAAKIRLAPDEVQATLVGHQPSDIRAGIEHAAARLRAVAPLDINQAAYILVIEARNAEFGFKTPETAAAISMLADALGIRAEYDAAKRLQRNTEPGQNFSKEQIHDAGKLTAKVLLSALPDMGDGHVAAELQVTATNTAVQVIRCTGQLTAENIATTMAQRAKYYSRSHDLADPQKVRNLREIDMVYNTFADTLGIKHLYLKAKADLSRADTPGDQSPLR